MEYISDINIQEAVIHIVDSNTDEPVLNEYSLELNIMECYTKPYNIFIFNHNTI